MLAGMKHRDKGCPLRCTSCPRLEIWMLFVHKMSPGPGFLDKLWSFLLGDVHKLPGRGSGHDAPVVLPVQGVHQVPPEAPFQPQLSCGALKHQGKLLTPSYRLAKPGNIALLRGRSGCSSAGSHRQGCCTATALPELPVVPTCAQGQRCQLAGFPSLTVSKSITWQVELFWLGGPFQHVCICSQMEQKGNKTSIPKPPTSCQHPF